MVKKGNMKESHVDRHKSRKKPEEYGREKSSEYKRVSLQTHSTLCMRLLLLILGWLLGGVAL